MVDLDINAKKLIQSSSVEETGSVTRVVSVTIGADNVNEAKENKYRDLKRTVSLKGFRKGKAPKDLLKRYYGDQIDSEVKSDLLGSVFKDLIETHDIHMVTEPEIQKAEINSDGDFYAELIFEVRPEIDPKDYKEIPLTREPVVVLDEAVDQRLENLRQQHATLKPIDEDRPAQEGDVAQIDFTANSGGGDFDGNKAEGFTLTLGQNDYIPGFDELVIGMKPDQTKDNLDIAVPEDYFRKDIAGKTLTFTITLKDLKVKELPELDDEFAKDLGGDFNTIAEVRDLIFANLKKGEQGRVRRNERKAIIAALLKANEFEVPKALIEEQIKAMMQNAKYQLVMSGLDINKAEELLAGSEERYRSDAETEVKAAFIFEAIAKIENIDATDEEVEAKIALIAEETRRNVEAVKAIYEKENALSRLKDELIEEKALDFLIENANVEWEEPVGSAKKETSEEK